MKRILKYSLLLFPFFILLLNADKVVAQRKTGQSLIDSLKVDLAKAKDDTNRVNLLKDLAYQYASINPELGIKYAQQGLVLATALSWKKGIAKCLNNMGIIFYFKKEYDTAYTHYEKALKLYTEIGYKKGMAISLTNMATINTQRGNYSKALDFSLLSLKNYEEINNKQGIADANGALGYNYHLSGDPEKALEYYATSLKINKELGNKSEVARLEGNMGLIFSNKGYTTKAMEYYTMAIKADEELGNKSEVARIEYNLGWICYNQAQYENAISWHFKAVEMYESLHDYNGALLPLYNIIRIYITKGDTAKVQEYTKIGLQLAEQSGNNQSIMNWLFDMGELYFYFDMFPVALDYYTKSLNVAEEISSKKDIARIKKAMGFTLFRMGNNPLSLEYGLEALKLFTELKDKGEIANVEAFLGNIFISLKEYQRALYYFKRYLAIEEEFGNQTQLGRAYLQMGMVYCDGFQNYDVALEYDQKALTNAEEAKSWSDMSTASGNMGEIYFEKGDYYNALKYAFKALQIDEKYNIQYNGAYVINSIAQFYIAALKDSTVYGRQWLDEHRVTDTALIPVGKKAILNKAFYYTRRALKHNLQAHNIEFLIYDYDNLAELYSLNGEYDKALANYKEFIKYKDSIFNNRKQKEASKIIAKAEYEHKADSVKLMEEKRELVLQEKLQLNALRYEFEMKQVAAKTDKEREQLRYEEEIRRNKIKFTFEQKRLTLEAEQKKAQLIQQKKDALAKQKLQQQRIYTYLGLSGIILLFGFLFFIARERAKSEKQRVRAERSEQFKQQFLANMSHEIRTPMNAVNGMTDLLLNKNPRPDQLNYLQVISKASDILLHIINDILDLSKIEVGKLELEAIDFSLKETIKQVKETLSFRAEEKGLMLITHLDKELDDIVVGDPYRLNQILLNLGGNAIKFTEKGSVEINVTAKPVENNKVSVRFTVSDTGIGIPKDKMQTLFESFRQAHSSDTRKFGGTGLGLSISKQLIEMHGGNIAVESEEGMGTTFTFVITYLIGSKENLNNRMAIDHEVDAHLLNGLRILLADDNEYNRMVVTETLFMKADVLIDEAVNGAEVIKLLEQHNYDIVLMDIQMPVMDGFEATEYIRAHLPYPKNKIPVIALTASILRNDIELCYKHGMNTYIPKPFKTWQLITAIAEQTGKINILQGHATRKQIKEDMPLQGINTNLAYLSKFCDGDEERMKKYINLYVKAASELENKLSLAVAEKNLKDIALIIHSYKPKWMMMGMKQSAELGQEIETLCTDPGNLNKIANLLGELIALNLNSIEELKSIV